MRDAGSNTQTMKQTNMRATGYLDRSTESLLFWKLRGQLFRRMLNRALTEARLRSLTVAIFSLALWIVLYLGFSEGFQLLNMMIAHTGTRLQTIHAVYNVFFLTLFTMMTISSGVIVYSTLYRSREVHFLLTTPTSVRRVVLHKFQETVLFAGWGLLLLGTPLLIAFGRQNEAAWFYYLSLIPFLVSFIILPVGVGTISCLVIIRFMPRLRMHATAGVGLVLLATSIGIAFYLFRSTSAVDLLTPEWFYNTLAQLRYSEQRLLPSWWLSTGLLEAATAHQTAPLLESCGFFCVLVSNALLIYLCVGWFGERFFLRGFSTLAGLERRRNHAAPRLVDRFLARVVSPLPKQLRPMLLKDVLIFRRDPLQWSQVLVFLALLTIYFLQTRRIYYANSLTRWVVMVSFLNLSVIGFMLATFTTRFIYPLISLEGRRIWVLATAPVTRESIIWGKFLLGLAIAVVPCTILTVVNDVMLRIPHHVPWVLPIHLLICFALCTGLSAIAVGLGARFPDLKENSPAKIAAGFGGTLTLVISALYVVGTVLITAVPTFFLVVEGSDAAVETAPVSARWWLLGLSVIVTAAVGITVTIVPMRIGLRAFRRLEL